MPVSGAIDRRRLVQLATASAASLWLPRSARSRVSLNTDPFGLGVASGSPTHDSVVLWTRLVAGDGWGLHASAGAITVLWEVADDEQFKRIVLRGQSQAVPDLAHLRLSPQHLQRPSY